MQKGTAKKWIEKIDNKKYASSWKDADILVQNAVSIDDWEKTMSAARDPFGEVLSRDIDETKYYKELPGAPDGEYVGIVFQTSFKNKKSSKEKVTTKKGEDGIWRVVGYFIE